MSEDDRDEFDSPPPPARPRTGRAGSWFADWARDTFSREALLSSLKSFLWVAPLTILIWVYAEREQPQTEDNQVIIFQIKSNDPRNLVTMINPEERSLLAQLRGSRQQVERVKELLVPKGDQPPVTINLSAEQYKPGGGLYTVPAAIIGEQDIFRNNYITVANISPPQLKFTVDVMETIDVDVQTPPLTNFPNFASPPVIEPRAVSVTGPKLVLDALRKDMRIVADLSRFREINTPGEHKLTVPLTHNITDKNVLIAPTSVKVTINVQELSVELQREAITIYVTYPPGLEADYRADYDFSLRSVTFQGPPAVIQQMQNNPAMQPKARFEVTRPTPENPAGTEVTAELKYDLPEGVRVSPADAKRTIKYRMIEQKPKE